ncbi:MAG: hypothetical protein ABI599_10940 [Flavobacteriales bacterium]
MDPRKRPWLIPIYVLAAILLFGGAVMLLWNAILPGLTGWGALTFPKAIGLLVLCRILFGGFHGKHGGQGGPPWRNRARWRDRWKNMSDEERTQMRDRWRDRCGPRWGVRPEQEGSK